MHPRTVIPLLISFLILLSPGVWAGGQNGPAMETYRFERDIHLAPGEFCAMQYDIERNEFIATEPEGNYGCLPDRALKQIIRAPKWVRAKFADRLVDLYYDDIDVGDDAAPVFADVNSDGLDDLLVGNAEGETACFLAPHFSKTTYYGFDSLVASFAGIANIDREASGRGFTIAGRQDGSIEVIESSGIDSQLRDNLARMKVAGKASPVFGDVTSDGIPDLLIGSSDGTISVYRNYGTPDDWWFISNNPLIDRKFDEDIGYLSCPRIHDMNSDFIEDIVTGGKNIPGLKIYYGPDYTETASFAYAEHSEPEGQGTMVPALGDFSGDGICDHAIGFDDGTVVIYTRNPQSDTYTKNEALGRGLKVASFAAPNSGDFNNDDRCDLIIGSGDGTVHLFYGTGSGFDEAAGMFDEMDFGEYPSPAGYDFNHDAMLDLVVGNKAGELNVFLAPDWEKVEGGLGIVNAGSYASPAFGDLNGDGIPELLIGSLDGTFRYLEGIGNAWAEKHSWVFHPTYGVNGINDFFTRTHPDSTLMRGAIDDETLNAFLDQFESCNDEYFDEVAFTIANTQTEMLRATCRLGNADLVVENARDIYDFASKVKYADIIEKDDYTTIQYISEDGSPKEMPRDIYYWWVVHPVVEYDIPARIDASFWRHDNEYYGITLEEWNRKEITAENYEHTPDASFWRTFLPVDRRYGKNLLDVVADAENIKEAAYLVADWITYSGSKIGKWNEYGLQSNDIQPLVIYEKNYGSCGEQAMLCAAFSRTALIPNAPVGCNGEDHAWNEWWMDGKWYQWDIGSAIVDLGHPWNERPGHTGTPLISISRRRGDGVVDNSTTRPVNPPGANYIPGGAPGYTEVGKVHINVVDEDGVPVEGALVIIRSKWNNYYRTSIWDYTDPEGRCDFSLGNPITGSCVVDIITPLGITGTEYFVMRENEEFSYTYDLPGRVNRTKLATTTGRHGSIGNLGVTVNVSEEEQRPHNYSGARGNPRNTVLKERAGFYGTRWYSEPNDIHYGVCAAVLSADEYARFIETDELPDKQWTKDDDFRLDFAPDADDVVIFYNPNRYTHVWFTAGLEIESPAEDPEIELTNFENTISTGEVAGFNGTASDNLHVASLKVSFNGGSTFDDITGCLDRTTGEFIYSWDTGDGGPITPGDYDVVFRVDDDSGAYAETKPRVVSVRPATYFAGQVIHQDNPDSPLPRTSWMLGPFTVGENERFLGIEGYSVEPEFDMDMYLYFDRNGNRKIDGDAERAGTSAGPSAVETILLNDPQPGAYWIFCQGWQVKERKDIDPWENLRKLSPGELMLLDYADVDRATAYALLDVTLSFNYTPSFIIDVEPSQELLVTEPVITGKFRDGFDVDRNSFRVTISGSDITRFVSFDNQGFAIDLGGYPLEAGAEYPVIIKAMTSNGIADSLTLNLTAYEPAIEQGQESAGADASAQPGQPSLLKLMPGDGANMYDFRSPLVAYYSLEIKDEVASARIILDGEDITNASKVYSDGIIYLPAELYSKGEHVFEIIATLSDGREIEAKSTFTILSMDEIEKK